MAKVIVAGASGFMGAALVDALRADGDQVVTVGRGDDADVRWTDPAGLADAVDGAELVVNLAGRSVNCRYTKRNREAILSSRVHTTEAIGAAIAAAAAPPTLWINASTATIYRHAETAPQTEADGEIDPQTFSERVAVAWEQALADAATPRTRRIALRTTIVLGRGGALPVLLRLAKLGLGGPHHDGWWPAWPWRRAAGTHLPRRSRGGRQKFSWIHLDDYVDVVRFLRAHPEIDGPINLATPEATDDRGLMRAVRRAVGARIGLPTYRWMLELGGVALRTEAELVIKSRWVIPQRLIDAGYEFRYTDIDDAVRSIASERSGSGSGPGSSS
ncbi:MAG TPA: DUF1731 domain-containing protein [Microbacteriaceae bacterium]|nr:DUF1731 domain-containing protein [Microbacteriaceae bacterium]